MNELMDSKQAAEYLGYTPGYFEQSRWKKMLGGIPHPKFFIAGNRKATYRKEDLDQWKKDYSEYLLSPKHNI